MRLEAGGLNVPIEVSERSSKRSVSTGRVIGVLEATAVANDATYHERFQGALDDQEESPFSLFNQEGEYLGHWRVRLKQWSHSEDVRPRYHYTMIVEELEEYEVDEIQIAGLTGTVLSYEERPEELGLVLDFVLKLSSEHHEAFRALWLSGGYHAVRRVGVDENDRSMRFGRVFWSTHDEYNKYQAVLVDEACDRPDEKPLTLDLPNKIARASLAYVQGVVDGISALLVEKGVISQNEVDSLLDRAKQESGKRSFDFFRVRDVEELI